MAYNSKWSDIPPELLEEVVNHLEIPSDSWPLRSVCSTWRSALPPRVFPDPLLPSTTDHLILFQPTTNDDDVSDGDDDVSNPSHRRRRGCHVSLAKQTFYHVYLPQSSTGWLIKTEEHRPGVFHLFSPFSRTCMEKKFSKYISSGNKLDLTNVGIRELGYEYILHNIPDDQNNRLNEQSLHDMEHQKVAVISTADSFSILSTHDTGKLLLYRSPLKEWSFLDQFSQLGYDDRSLFVNDWSLHYVDVVEYRGLFYAVTNSGRTVEIKVASDAEVTVTLLTKSIIGGDKKCLVKVSDELLMVDLYTCPTPGTESLKVHAVDVFRLDRQQGRWVLMKDLGDHALFLSNHSCFSVSISTLSVCKSNCIYFHFKSFADKEFCSGKQNNNDDVNVDNDESVWSTKDEIGVFDLEKGINGLLGDYLEDLDLFSWPPPSWITWKQ